MISCSRHCLSGDALIETVDGPLTIASLVGKSIPVLTRLPNRQIGFRLMSKIACTANGVDVVRVTFENGHTVVVDRTHVFFAPNGAERAAATLDAGELLDASFHFPTGYVYRRLDGSAETAAGGIHVTAVEPAGTADVFTGIVKETQTYFLTAGVLCKA